MPSFNQITFLGHCGRDPQTRQVGDTSVTEFSLAANRKWKASNGDKRESVCFFDCKCWGNAGTTIAQYVKKGDALLISGYVDQEKWEDKNGGGNRSKHVIVVDNFQFLGGRDEAAGEDERKQSKGSAPASAKFPRPTEPASAPFTDEKQFEEDDIPF